jgi:hypothetical protein
VVAERQPVYDVQVAETIATQQKRSLHRNGSFHAVGKEVLAIGDMADYFESTPPAGYGPGAQLLVGHPGYGEPQFFDALLVGRNQVCDGERVIVSLGICGR